ncbi:tRNA lysidine(34) synthetase TilS [Bacillus pseudomycoides]|uniref:tRNA(Ile)-lysidine synthase n=1 Tax=Bacillus pseudomycoides TaxID=64104 RepID=A0AA91VBW3_9BACI|nr:MULTISPECIES: tRNA lysidine(34) synthetase TilS [Bacillus]PEB51986.1 tRNA lysidine(34) synthetase TilS [Bacillus sp. AFS098217]PED82367.1 tRNA lysidine(34) synthetase TilS [Bacillus pseudomycoides]PEU15445.1 tRNA lysidine(34) synthetase TilS [Bacillus sp. AFS019443]PEU20440.1 tRNA lysidine(34) synthetase TilS [Bacillus sp. AFS014408]PFW60976.1 tRNA lysidine(34) synthetase TilS [Bacillus sp. AFS075034]
MKDTFVEKVDDFVKQHDVLEEHSTIVVGVSGGPDSLALLYYLLEKREEKKLKIVVAHVDHMFRGDESYEDLRFVENLCQEIGVICETIRINVSQYQQQYGMNAQVAARECRYAFLERIMKKYDAPYVALGHHGDDQVETILMRLVRGSTPKGYAGIAVKRPFHNGYLIRPLLAVTKEEIVNYCNSLGIIPRMDPSNEKEIYTRNRLRKYVLPYLKEENPHVHERFQKFSMLMQEDEAYLQELAFEKMNKVITKKSNKHIVLSIPVFESMSMPLQRRGIQLILNYLYEYKIPSSLSSIHIDKVIAFFKRTQPSGSLDFPEGLKIVRTYEECSFRFKQEIVFPFSQVLSVPGAVTLANGDKIIAEINEEIPSNMNETVFVAKYNDISYPLLIRSRENGDRMSIQGMSGTKKIKAIFIEAKVPKEKREEWPIVCDASGNIIWVPLLKRSAFAISQETANKDKYMIIHYKSKESSGRIMK